MIKTIFGSTTMEGVMHTVREHFAGTLLGLSAIVTLGCSDTPPTALPTGAIEITVSTAGADVDIDSDGYSLEIALRLPKLVGVNDTATFRSLPTGGYLVFLGSAARNCSVTGVNPRLVYVIAGEAPSQLSFSVLCVAGPHGDPWDF